jgi:hypothetical protein
MDYRDEIATDWMVPSLNTGWGARDFAPHLLRSALVSTQPATIKLSVSLGIKQPGRAVDD